MDSYNEELQKVLSFAEDNKELVESALGLIAISIMNTLNKFNVLESKITTIIANYYIVSYSPKLDFKADVLETGYLSYGQKLKILDMILEKSGFYTNKSADSRSLLSPLKILGDLRNDIVHSVYGLDPERVNSSTPKTIFYANGRKISKKDLLVVFSDFEKYHSKSDTRLNEVADFLLGKEKVHE